MLPYEWIWAGLMVLFLVVEAACPIHLVSIWFAAGSLVALVAALLGAQLGLQIALFAILSLGLLICLWPLTKKILNPHLSATNVDSVIGSTGYVQEEIDNQLPTGRVKLGGMEWTARSQSGKNIPAGTLVKVERVEGVKVFVSPVE